MANASETKVTRRNAILTTGKAAVALGAAVLLTGRLPKIQPLDDGDPEDKDMDEEQQPAGGLATAAVTYMGTDDDETGADADVEAPTDKDETGGFSTHLVDLGLVPIQFVISEIDSTGGTPVADGHNNVVSVMTIAGNTSVQVWTDQQGAQAILPTSARPIVVGTSVDVEALEDAIRGSPVSKIFFTINAGPDTLHPLGHKYLLLAFGSPSTAPPQDEDSDGD